MSLPHGPSDARGKASRHVTVLVLLEAGRSDYVRPDTMPFLHGLANASLQGAFEAPPGFAQRTVLFSGRYPDTSGSFGHFAFDPEGSPFAWVGSLGPLRSLVRPRRMLYPARWAIQRLTEWRTGAHHADPAWVPPHFLPFFTLGEGTRPLEAPGALGAPSIFDLCRRHGLTYRYLTRGARGDDEETHRLLVRALRAREAVDLYVVQLAAADPARPSPPQGRQGAAAARPERSLRDLDGRLAGIHAALAANHESWDLLVCGDHGQAPIERRVDVGKAVARSGAKPAKDYVLLVNSTLAVAWYLTEKGRVAIEKALRSVPGAHLVDDAERRRRRIPVGRRWGDRMLAAEPGVLFWPDHFHVTDSTVVGMHGYLDRSAESYGLALLASSNGHTGPRRLGLRPLVDVFPTLCELLRVPVPDGQEGVSLLLAPAPVAPPASGLPSGA